MALTDFLGKDIGGMAQAVNDPGGLGVSAGVGRTGITWGQLLQNLMQRDRDPTTQAFAPLVGRIGRTPVTQVPGMQQVPRKQKSNDMSDLKDVMEVGSWLFGMGG